MQGLLFLNLHTAAEWRLKTDGLFHGERLLDGRTVAYSLHLVWEHYAQKWPDWDELWHVRS